MNMLPYFEHLYGMFAIWSSSACAKYEMAIVNMLAIQRDQAI